MSLIDHDKQYLNLKFVFYGPEFCGKTTNMQYIYERTGPHIQIDKIFPVTNRTLSFDFRPLALGKIRGLDCRFHLYTVPGLVLDDESRALVLKGVDGIVFVADSQARRAEANVESLENLETDLARHGYSLDEVPMVLQYTKRDLPEISTVAELDAILNAAGRQRFEGIARTGVGVFEALKAVAQHVLTKAKVSEGSGSQV
jgi:signal recognition particle receptor subunit beta